MPLICYDKRNLADMSKIVLDTGKQNEQTVQYKEAKS